MRQRNGRRRDYNGKNPMGKKNSKKEYNNILGSYCINTELSRHKYQGQNLNKRDFNENHFYEYYFQIWYFGNL